MSPAVQPLREMRTGDALALLRSHLPDQIVEQIVALGHQGWGGDSDAFLVNCCEIARFPRSDDVREALAVEARLLPCIAPLLPLPVPRFDRVVYEAGNPRPLFATYPFIAGLQLSAERLAGFTAADRSACAAQIGAFVGALQRVPLELTRAAGVPVIDGQAAQRTLFDAARGQVFPLASAALVTWLRRLFEPLLEAEPWRDAAPALSHGDLNGDQILYELESKHLCGVIDFSDCHIGDPALDFAGLLLDYGEHFCRLAVESSGARLDPHAELRLRFYTHRAPLLQVLHGLRHEIVDDIHEGMRRLEANANGARGA